MEYNKTWSDKLTRYPGYLILSILYTLSAAALIHWMDVRLIGVNTRSFYLSNMALMTL